MKAIKCFLTKLHIEFKNRMQARNDYRYLRKYIIELHDANEEDVSNFLTDMGHEWMDLNDKVDYIINGKRDTSWAVKDKRVIEYYIKYQELMYLMFTARESGKKTDYMRFSDKYYGVKLLKEELNIERI